MEKKKKQPTLTKKVVIAWMIVVVISNFVIGTLSYNIYRKQLLNNRANEAQNVAVAIAVRIDGDKFTEILSTFEKNQYWHEIKAYADRISVVFNTAFIYILDGNYTDEVTYFAEGAPGDSPFDLGMTESIEGIYADEMFDTLRTGEPCFTAPYPSGEYGDMVSGFAAITNESGKIVGVVGVDFYYEDVYSQLNEFALSIIIFILIFMVFCYFLMTYLGTKLAGKPLSELDEAAQHLAVGDMNINFNIKSTTEIGRLASSFSTMIDGIKNQVATLELLSQGDLTIEAKPRSNKDTMGIAIVQILDNLNSIFQDISQAAVRVSDGAHQISDNAQALAHGAHAQSNAVAQLSSYISDVTDKANENLKVATQTNNLAEVIKSDAQVGSQHMDKMTIAVKDISDASASINKVIKVIDDIAFQTNILALNAAVEAARAGEHGKGFAIVAEEVRNLAAKSAEAAKDTELLILDSIEKAKLGASIANETASSFDSIIQGINECAVLVNGIAGSFEEQINAMLQINDSVQQVSQVVQQNSSAAEESAVASQEMSDQSALLADLVSHFKLK